MNIELNARRDGSKISIFADIYGDIAGSVCLTAERVKFITRKLYETDTHDTTLLTISDDEARKFAKQILELVGD
ncbi:unnamed protein product [marine sediment metagenome]|uniref:Uncharacterized protein n=1 Tax=marine sediment metagenome TaxID=412755 RepID=X0SZA8_9ZZZZ